MESLEFRMLRAGEEKAALDFFYSNFVKKEGQLCSVGAGWNEVVTRDILAMLLAGAQFSPLLLLFLALIHLQRVISTKKILGPTLVAVDATGQMVGQLVMEIHERGASTTEPPSFQELLSRWSERETICQDG